MLLAATMLIVMFLIVSLTAVLSFSDAHFEVVLPNACSYLDTTTVLLNKAVTLFSPERYPSAPVQSVTFSIV